MGAATYATRSSFMFVSVVNLERMCAISFSTRFFSWSGFAQLRRSEMKAVRRRASMTAIEIIHGRRYVV